MLPAADISSLATAAADFAAKISLIPDADGAMRHVTRAT